MKRNERHSKNTSTDSGSKGHAVIYCRVSTKEQVENLSLSTQELRSKEYCASNGWDVDKVFVDRGESAKTTDRPAFQEMLSHCEKNREKIGCVVVYQLSRFARQSYDHQHIRAYLAKFDIVLRSVTEPIDDTSVGKLMENILSGFAQFDNDVRKERTEAGMLAGLQLGRWTHRRPLGYMKPAGYSVVSMVHDPERAKLIRVGFEMFASGGYKIKDVLKKLNSLGLTTSKGKEVTFQTFSKILRNPLFRGWIHVPKWGIDRAGDFEPIVSDEVFYQVQHFLKRGAKRGSNNQVDHPDFPLRRFVSCASCGSPLTGSWSSGRTKKYPYYRCPTKECKSVNIRSEKLEELFLTKLSTIQPGVGVVKLFGEVLKDVWDIRQEESRKLSANLRRRIDQILVQRERLEGARIFERSINQDTYERQARKVSESLTDAQMELAGCEGMRVDLKALLSHALPMLSTLKSSWQSGDLPLKQKLQAAIFPSGLKFDSESFGTAVTSSVFNVLQGIEDGNTCMATPTGIEPVFQP